jgi:hypothetical protein
MARVGRRELARLGYREQREDNGENADQKSLPVTTTLMTSIPVKAVA